MNKVGINELYEMILKEIDETTEDDEDLPITEEEARKLIAFLGNLIAFNTSVNDGETLKQAYINSGLDSDETPKTVKNLLASDSLLQKIPDDTTSKVDGKNLKDIKNSLKNQIRTYRQALASKDTPITDEEKKEIERLTKFMNAFSEKAELERSTATDEDPQRPNSEIFSELNVSEDKLNAAIEKFADPNSALFKLDDGDPIKKAFLKAKTLYEKERKANRSDAETMKDVISNYKKAMQKELKKYEKGSPEYTKVKQRWENVLKAFKEKWGETKDAKQSIEAMQKVDPNVGKSDDANVEQSKAPLNTVEDEINELQNLFDDIVKFLTEDNYTLSQDSEGAVPAPADPMSPPEDATPSDASGEGSLGDSADPALSEGFLASIFGIETEEEDELLKKLKEGIPQFIDYFARLTKFKNPAKASGFADQIKQKYSRILDSEGRLKFNQIKPSAYTEVLKQALEKNKDALQDAAAVNTLDPASEKAEFDSTFAHMFAYIDSSELIAGEGPSIDYLRRENKKSMEFDADKYAKNSFDKGPAYFMKTLALLKIRDLDLEDEEKQEMKQKVDEMVKKYFDLPVLNIGDPDPSGDGEITPARYDELFPTDFGDEPQKLESETNRPGGLVKSALEWDTSILSASAITSYIRRKLYDMSLEEPHVEIEMDDVLEKLARAMKFGTVNEEKKTMADFFKSFKTGKKDYLQKVLTKNKFSDEEVEKLAWYFSKKENFLQFLEKYFPDEKRTMRRNSNIFFRAIQGVEDFFRRKKKTKPEFMKDNLEEALKPIIKSTIKEILEK